MSLKKTKPKTNDELQKNNVKVQQKILLIDCNLSIYGDCYIITMKPNALNVGAIRSSKAVIFKW